MRSKSQAQCLSLGSFYQFPSPATGMLVRRGSLKQAFKEFRQSVFMTLFEKCVFHSEAEKYPEGGRPLPCVRRICSGR
jgi:hypothetical protein